MLDVMQDARRNVQHRSVLARAALCEGARLERSGITQAGALDRAADQYDGSAGDRAMQETLELVDHGAAV